MEESGAGIQVVVVDLGPREMVAYLDQNQVGMEH